MQVRCTLGWHRFADDSWVCQECHYSSPGRRTRQLQLEASEKALAEALRRVRENERSTPSLSQSEGAVVYFQFRR
jgi:hypothetical protein